MVTNIEEVATREKKQHENKSTLNETDLPAASEKFTEGLLAIYQLPLEYVKQEVNELRCKQESCIMQMELENKELCDVQEDIELNDLFSTIQTYQKLLLNIKTEIMIIHEKMLKLKKRALKFQQAKSENVASTMD